MVIVVFRPFRRSSMGTRASTDLSHNGTHTYCCYGTEHDGFQDNCSLTPVFRCCLRPSDHSETTMPRRTDPMTEKQRSHQMALIKSRGTKPELTVRRALWRLGYRYRLNVTGIPGKPDIVFKRRRKAIFVHGCFWHRHPGCSRTRIPKTRIGFWQRKFMRTVERDHYVQEQLAQQGWHVLVVWECESETPRHLNTVLRRFLEHTT